MSKPVIQLRAIAYYLEQNRDLKLQLSLVHEIWFIHKVTREQKKVSITHILNLYENRNKQEDARNKAMRKELRNGHGTKRKPDPVRRSSRITQTTITGDDVPGAEDTPDDSLG